MNSDDRAYAISAANLEALERNLNYLANNVGEVDEKVLDVNEKVNKVTQDVAAINTNIKELISEIRETTIITNAKQSISLDQDEINKKYGHYDNLRRKISGLFQAIEVGAVDKKSIKELKEKAIVDTPDYWLSSAFVAICAWLNNKQDEANNALKDAIKKDDEKTSLFFSLINLKFERYTSSYMWLKRYLDMQDAAKIENKIVPLLDTLTNGILDSDGKEYFLNKILLWTEDLNAKSNYKTNQINRWIDKLVTLINDKDYDEYYYIKNYTNKYKDINRLTNISTSQKNIYNFILDLINEKENYNLNKKEQIEKIINLLIYNYENEELDLRKDIAKNKLIVEENGNTSIANEKFKSTEFAYHKNSDFYSILSNIILESNELKPSINTKKLSLAFLKNTIKNSYKELSSNTIDNSNIMITINKWTSSTTDGMNEKELITSLFNHIDSETNIEIQKVKLIDLKMILTFIFGVIFAIVLFIIDQSFLSIGVLLVTLGILLYSLYNNYKEKNKIIKQREERKKEEKKLLQNIIAEIVDFRFVYKDGIEMQNKILNLLDSLDYKNYIKSNDNRNIDVVKQKSEFNFNSTTQNKTNLFDKETKISSKIDPPTWDLTPPYENVRMVDNR